MGSVTAPGQVNLDKALEERNKLHRVHHADKAEKRKGIKPSGLHENADSWWKERDVSSASSSR
jgi:hypothetical protein